jgi:predicted nucleic acid-binding protein
VTIWVVDTGPLIFLTKLGCLEFLRHEADTVYVPRAVLTEVQAKPDETAAEIEEATRSWLVVQEVGDRRTVEILMAALDLGEAEVIVLAKEVDADRVVMDDLDARRFARRAGFDLVGTFGLLLAAGLRGDISSLKEKIDQLWAFGFYAAPDLVEAILKEAGE